MGQHRLIVVKVVEVEDVAMHFIMRVSGGPFSVSISFFLDSPILIQLTKIHPIVGASEVAHERIRFAHDAVAAECQF